MDIKISSKFAIVILGIGIFSTLLAFDKSFPVESANAQGMGHGMDGGGSSGMGGGMSGGSSGMGGGMSGGSSGMGGGMSGGSSGMGGGGHGMMMMMNVPGFVQQMCHMGKDMPPLYCEPNYKVMSSVKGLKISNVNPINDNELQVVINSINSVSNATTTTTGQQNIVVVGGGGDLAGSTVLDITGGSQKITTELKLIGSGSIYNLEHIHLHLFPLTTQ